MAESRDLTSPIEVHLHEEVDFVLVGALAAVAQRQRWRLRILGLETIVALKG